MLINFCLKFFLSSDILFSESSFVVIIKSESSIIFSIFEFKKFNSLIKLLYYPKETK